VQTSGELFDLLGECCEVSAQRGQLGLEEGELEKLGFELGHAGLESLAAGTFRVRRAHTAGFAP
jgi:hypothetical protein